MKYIGSRGLQIFLAENNIYAYKDNWYVDNSILRRLINDYKIRQCCRYNHKWEN